MSFLSSLFQFENPGIVAIAVGVLIFTVVFTVITKFKLARGVAIVISIIIGIIGAWKLYTEGFYGWEVSLGLVLLLVVIAVVGKIIWSFVKGTRSHFRS